jgi:bifunctional DNase/RNase
MTAYTTPGLSSSDETQKEEYIDYRPSMRISVALRAGEPVFIEEEVLAAGGQNVSDLPAMTDRTTFLQKYRQAGCRKLRNLAMFLPNN